MRRACLFSVLQLVAFTAAWYVFFRGRVEPPALFVFAAIAGLLGAIAVGLAWSVILRGRERRALARAVAGLPPEDGRLSAAAGRIQASGPAWAAERATRILRADGVRPRPSGRA